MKRVSLRKNKQERKELAKCQLLKNIEGASYITASPGTFIEDFCELLVTIHSCSDKERIKVTIGRFKGILIECRDNMSTEDLIKQFRDKYAER